MMTTSSAIPVLGRVFEEGLRSTSRGSEGATSSIPADIFEKDNEFTFQLDVPGVKIEDLQITLTDRVLAVRGVRHFEAEESDTGTRGRHSRPLAVSYELPEGIDGENLTAGLADGVLTVRVPKQPKMQPRKIAIASRMDGEQVRE
jgi:HSP20 family protein